MVFYTAFPELVNFGVEVVQTVYHALGSTARLDCPIRPGKLVSQYYCTWKNPQTGVVFFQIPPPTNPASEVRLNGRYSIDHTNLSLFINNLLPNDDDMKFMCELGVQDTLTSRQYVTYRSQHTTLILSVFCKQKLCSQWENSIAIYLFFPIKGCGYDRLHFGRKGEVFTDFFSLALSDFLSDIPGSPVFVDLVEPQVAVAGGNVTFTCTALSAPHHSKIGWGHLEKLLAQPFPDYLPPLSRTVSFADRTNEGVTYSLSNQALKFREDPDGHTLFVETTSSLTVEGIAGSDDGSEVTCFAFYINNTDTHDLIAHNISNNTVTVLSKLEDFRAT